jgi:hypothetical protein
VRFLHACERGMTVGYDRSWVAPADTVIATVACGFADGFSRMFSNCGNVGLRGSLFPIAGKARSAHEGPKPFYDLTLSRHPQSSAPSSTEFTPLPSFHARANLHQVCMDQLMVSLSLAEHGPAAAPPAAAGPAAPVPLAPASAHDASVSGAARLAAARVRVGDYATLFGAGGTPLALAAKLLGTCESDLTCALTRRVARRYVNKPASEAGCTQQPLLTPLPLLAAFTPP